MISETLAVLTYFVAGALTVRALGARGVATYILGFFVGIGMVQAALALQVMTPLPTHPGLALALAVAAGVAVFTVRFHGRGLGFRWWEWPLVVAAVSGAVALFRWARLVKWHSDSFDYLIELRLLRDGHFYQSVDAELLAKRGLGVTALHSGAVFDDTGYLASITPILAIMTLAALAYFVARGLAGTISTTQVVTFASLGVLLLATGNRPVHHAFYLNGHLLTGAMVMVAAAALWVISRRPGTDSPALTAAVLAASTTATLTRAEGTLMMLLVLVPAVTSASIPLRIRRLTVVWTGAILAAWSLLGVWMALRLDSRPENATVAQVGLGLAVMAAGFWFLDRKWLVATPERTLKYAAYGVWLAFGLLGAVFPYVYAESAYFTLLNQLGAGRWGLTLWIVGVLVVAVLIALRPVGDAVLRFPVAMWIPFVFILAALREGAYRLGILDSLNRMWMQILPLAVLFVVVRLAAGRWRFSRPAAWQRDASDRSGT